MNTVKRALLTLIAAAAVLVPASTVDAWHPIIRGSAVCADAQGNYTVAWTVTADADRANTTWSVNGSAFQADQIPFTFTTSHSLSGGVPSFTANAVWSNGEHATNYAKTGKPSTCTTTTPATTTTLAPTTTSTTSTTTSVSPTSTSTIPAATTTTPATTPSTSTTPPTNAPSTTSSTSASTVPSPPTTPAPTPPPTSPPTPQIPVTGSDAAESAALLGGLLLAVGVIVLLARPQRKGWNETP